MTRLLLVLATCFFLSCNNSENKDSKDASEKSTASWPKEEENDLLDGCIETLQNDYSMPQDSAFMHCNCVVKQLKDKFPNIDSAAAVMQSNEQAAPYVANCR